MADDIYSDDYINQASVALIEEQNQEPEFDEANAIFLFY